MPGEIAEPEVVSRIEAGGEDTVCCGLLQANVLANWASSASGGKVKKIIINRLFQSFAELEQAIVAARVTLAGKKNVSSALLERIDTYEQILAKQRNLATVLCGYAAVGNWDEVGRHIKLINGLSHMIRDDAREILGIPEPQIDNQQHDVTYC